MKNNVYWQSVQNSQEATILVILLLARVHGDWNQSILDISVNINWVSYICVPFRSNSSTYIPLH